MQGSVDGFQGDTNGAVWHIGVKIMSWVVRHAQAIKRICWITVAVLSLLIVVAVVDRYQRQYLMLLESQQALLAQRSAAPGVIPVC
jgi:hypothetical protein